ncbi:T6SS phospholipase effector Tle1-like catalytic domain-containing protein, partial [Xanthomonas fragariae]
MSGDPNVIAPRVRAVENMVARAREKTRTKSGGPACVNCHVPLWISFFFDGTGNHRNNDFPRNHSNIAALYDAQILEPTKAIISLYYEGIGTPFEFKDRYERKPIATRGGTVAWTDETGCKEDESSWNKGFGTGLESRLEKALFDFQLAIENQQSLTRVDEINVAAFGFSRGATEARAFVNWLANHSKVKISGNSLTYDGIPLSFKFLGIFDTVESVGGAGVNKRPELVKISLPSYVQKCLHIVAAHELRNAFPLTHLGTNRYTQVVYPGAHADVGGGYSDKEQGRTNKLARIALLQMLDHARGTGLKLRSVEEMQQSAFWHSRFAPSYDVSTEHHAALQGYLSNVKKKSGLIKEVMTSHMELYWGWIDAGLAMQDLEQKREALPNGYLNPDDKPLRTMEHLLRYQGRTQAARTGTPNVAGRRTVAPEVEHFFE